MLRNKLGKIFSSRIFFMIFALLAAVALWVYVEISENETQYREVNAEVVFINDAILRDRGFLVSSFEPPTVRLLFEAPLSVVAQLNDSTVSVEIDLANIHRTGHQHESYRIDFPVGINRAAITTSSASVELITLLIDQVSVRTIPVRAIYTGGTAADDLFAEPVIVEPQTITIEGPEAIISQISHAQVPIFRENLSSTYVDNLPFILINELGYEVEDDYRNFVTSIVETIHVTVPIKQTKVVTLDVALSHAAGSSDQNTRWSIEPPFITVSGDPEALRDFSSTHILNVIDMSQFTSSATESFPIILPPQIHNDSGESSATVMIDVLGLASEDFAVENLFVINTPPEHYVEFVSRVIDVRLRGREADLTNITEMNIRVVADLSDIITEPLTVPDRFRVPARVYIDGTDADIGAIGETRITIRLIPDSWIPPETPEPPESDEPDSLED